MTASPSGGPLVVRTRAELAEALLAASSAVALVPTMGALHEGHASLLDHARGVVGPEGRLVASIFVNPMQFGAGEDLDRYPRTLDSDLERCAAHGVDVAFVPTVDEVYPGGEPEVSVEPGPRALLLEGASRPGHFRGVLTVVAKLFGLVRPDVAVFGEKDYQQLVLIRRMTRDLCLGIEVQGAPTVRDPDGLALSSRNRFLSAPERARALALSGALAAGRDAGAHGGAATLDAARAVLAAGGVEPDYLALTGPDLEEAPSAGDARLLVAARVGATRLIDNTAVRLGTPRAPD
ncbi:pantoate--beta-alanine ligase [Nocardioides sp. HDW12B]|uniref:pantoate--beta-alanine ligase n=1 Tax=Nocardioides sp. HDW12B TaxID=2714939 RepID=UPI0014077574|nr:pantoate--beta-alanine ligase [Nocardioides sp. HDW12B]QIK65099.1 pantoate--beta-alanine ligase [Nocardioides sp. HDW12B]